VLEEAREVAAFLHPYIYQSVAQTLAAVVHEAMLWARIGKSDVVNVITDAATKENFGGETLDSAIRSFGSARK
jgi:hypothetical protein